MITAKGAGVLAAAIAIYVLARLSQVGWLYLVDAVFWGALVLALVMPWLGVVFIRARRSILTQERTQPDRANPSGRLFEGDLVNITISLKNRLFHPRFFHSIKFDAPVAGPESAQQNFFVAHLPGSGVLQLESNFEAYQRGLHHLGPVKLESSAPLGLFRRRKALSEPQPMLVLPRVYPLSRMILVDGEDRRSVKARMSRTGLDLAGSRPYVQGDSRRMVHWRNTARAGRMMVKETEDQTDQALHIMFDSGEVAGEGRDSNFEYAIKLVVSVADYALRNGVPVRVWGSHLSGAGVTVPGLVGHPPGVNLTWPELLESLAVARPEGCGTLGEGLASLPASANLFIVVSANRGLDSEALSRALVRAGEFVMVRLEGFGSIPTDIDADQPQDWAGSPVISCRPGGLAQTLSEIESLNRAHSPAASTDFDRVTATGLGSI